MASTTYRYELRRDDTITAAGHITYDAPLHLGDEVTIGRAVGTPANSGREILAVSPGWSSNFFPMAPPATPFESTPCDQSQAFQPSDIEERLRRWGLFEAKLSISEVLSIVVGGVVCAPKVQLVGHVGVPPMGMLHCRNVTGQLVHEDIRRRPDRFDEPAERQFAILQHRR